MKARPTGFRDIVSGRLLPERPRPWIYVIGDEARARPRPLVEVMAGAAGAGADMLQVREPGLTDAGVVDLGRSVQAAVEEFGAMVLVNERFDLALAAGAAGVHLKASGMPTEVVRRHLGPGPVVARSTHSPEEARRAGEGGADFVVFGPVFATPSKAAYGPPAGLERLDEACRVSGIPVLAIGGVTPGNAAACVRAGAAGIAVIRAVMDSDAPDEAVRGLRAAALGATPGESPEGERRG